MAKYITFIRHAESTGNRSGLWQGHIDADLSENGRDQVARLARRLAGRQFDRVVASDLQRARATSEAVGGGEPDERWRELDLGDWEGLSTDEINERSPGALASIVAGDEFTVPGGESSRQFTARLSNAYSDLEASLDDGGHAVAVSHGGAIQTLISGFLGMGPAFASPIQVPMNTSLTTVRIEEGRRQVFAFNDAEHVGESVHVVPWSGTDVFLFRHGETEGNAVSRWQGRGDSALTADGVLQARGLAESAPTIDRLFASPLGRAHTTATAVAASSGHEVQVHHELVEMDFGAWEDKTALEAEELDPEHFDLIYRQGVDLPRGRNGESFADAGERLASAIASIVDQHEGERIGLVTHGGAARAYLAHVLGIGFSERHLIPVLRNTARARIVYRERGPLLAEYNVAPHLEG